MFLVSLVFGEVEGHPADDAPERVFIVQVGAQSYPGGEDFVADVSVEVGPGGPEDAGIEVLEALHGRGFEGDGVEFGLHPVVR